MRSDNNYLVAALGVFLLFALATLVLVGNELKAPINDSTRFSSIDWLDEKLAGVFPNSTSVQDFHQAVILGAIEMHEVMELGYIKLFYIVICVLLLAIFAVLVSLHLAIKSLESIRAKYLRNVAADGRLTYSNAGNREFEYVSFTRPGMSVENSEEPMVMMTRAAIMKNPVKIDANLETFLFPENAI